MRMWMGLLKKELRLQRDFMIGAFVVLVLLGIVGVWMSLSGHENVATLFLIVPLIWHFLFLPTYLLASLNFEWKHTAATWLQMPLAGWKLLIAKLISGGLYFLGAFTLSFLSLTIAMRFGHVNGPLNYVQITIQDQGGNVGEFVQHVIQSVGRTYFYLFAFTLYINLLFTPVVILFNVVRQWLRGTIYKFTSWLMFAISVVCIWLVVEISQSEAYQTLTHWGYLGYRSGGLQFGPFFVGELLLLLLLSVGMIAAAGWLLDRKVQV